MKLTNTICLDVDTPDGAGILQMIYLTELGLVMGKVFFPEKKTYINYRLSNIDNLFESGCKIQKNLNSEARYIKPKRRKRAEGVTE